MNLTPPPDPPQSDDDDPAVHAGHVSIPANYAPFGVQQINGLIYVSYAQQMPKSMMTSLAPVTASSTSSPPMGSS